MIFDLFTIALAGIAVYYGRVAWRLLIRSRPLVQASWVLAVFWGLLGLPFGALLYLMINRDVPMTWFTLTGPLLYGALVVFYSAILRGVLFYGIPEPDFSQALRQALEAEGMAFSEQIGRIELLGRDFDLSYSYNPTTGSGFLRFRRLKSKDNRSTARRVLKFFRERLTLVLQPRRRIGILYAVFCAGLLVVAVQLFLTALRSP